MNNIDTYSMTISIVTSFIASVVFASLFAQIKPRIRISDKIIFHGGQYKIKVLNYSLFRAINIKAELAYLNDGVGETITENISLRKSEVFLLERCCKKSSDYTFVVNPAFPNCDLLETLHQGSYNHVRIQLSATHSLTNTGNVFRKTFTIDKIVIGQFQPGAILTIH